MFSKFRTAMLFGAAFVLIALGLNNFLVFRGTFRRESFDLSMNIVSIFFLVSSVYIFRTDGTKWFGDMLPPEHPVNEYLTKLFALLPLLLAIAFVLMPWASILSSPAGK